MTLRQWLPLVAFVAVPFAVVYGLHRLSRWHAGRHDQIDDLIASNVAKPRKGMAHVDWQKTDKAGERRWQETLRAQRRARQTPRHSKPQAQNVVSIKGTRRSA